MRNRLTNLRRTTMIASALAIASSSFALFADGQIVIDRAVNSPTLNVRYEGTKATLAEIRVNGESVSTRSLDGAKDSGEITFSLNLKELREGDNDIEIRLYDKTGKLVATKKTVVTTEQEERGPVYITIPKNNATVQGPVEIKIGFGREFRSAFVSFFIDNNFKSMTNFMPYTYVWDTSKETNGWHEVEAWVVDESTNTYKSRKVRIFVNNPGGRTERANLGAGNLATSANVVNPGVISQANGVRNVVAGASVPTNTATAATMPKISDVKTVTTSIVNKSQSPTTKVVKTAPSVNLTAPVTSANLAASAVTVKAPITKATGVKPVEATGSVAMGPQNMTPTGKRVINAAKAITTTPKSGYNLNLNSATAVTSLMAITKGQRLSGVSTFAVLLNGRFVEFDVAPRVDEGIPMTPFRHLIEKAGGKVSWVNMTKTVEANAEGKSILLRIGDPYAKVNQNALLLEMSPYIDRGRTIVPLTFIAEALNVKVDYDKSTGHVLITNKS